MKEGNYNMAYKEKLKFQFSIYFKNYAYIIIAMILFAVGEGMANVTISLTLNLDINDYYNQQNQVAMGIILTFLLASTDFVRMYSETASHFISIGFTRRKYYLGNVIAVLLTSLVTSAACFASFFMSLKSDASADHYKFIQCFGYKFLSFNVLTALQIIILITAIYTFVYMLSNLAGVLGMILMIRGKYIVPIIMTMILGLLGVWVIYYPAISNYVFRKFISINNSYALYIMVLIMLNFLVYILGKNIFMKIDIKNR